ncbi:MAG: uracil phosphoribosyltransferase [Bacteroidetes bacterium GWA2_30_7]|nr:MAG: uracil phosphoribosyltransferase [Bacteroidetes bacterium GWA2_30_7]
MVINLGENNSILNQFIAEIRDENIQKDSMRFRKNLERIGEVFAYEISKKLSYKFTEVQTPLGIANENMLDEKPILATILRAGLPIHTGFLNFFDTAENAFISAYRKYEKDGSFEIKVEYISCPCTDDKTVIISDPMLASGSSMVLAYKALLEKGLPRHTHIVTIIASKEGVEYLNSHLNMQNITLWVGAIDDELTVKSYIVPGLGDAGDLAYGNKS